MKKPITYPPGCVFSPNAFQERMRKETCNRIDLFFSELRTNKARTRREWMKEFSMWSMSHSL